MANPWDPGSARILAGLGFKALATSSGASAAVLGRRDGRISREDCLAHCRSIAAPTSLPVAGDLENGFGDTPEVVAETIRLAADAGLVGGSIEDSGGSSGPSMYAFHHSVERVAAASEAARALPFHFMLTARCENFSRDHPDLDDTVKRLVAYEAAGADILFAPSLPSLDAVRAVCSSVSKPVNFMVGVRGKAFSVRELEDAGVRRISFATSLYRAAIAGLIAAANEINVKGTFCYLDSAVATAELAPFLEP
jgi:2-methylisocitrate lyase-like PEP mutase family enzyme